MKISSVHEHAEYYPMLSDEQLDELAADIRENGQRDPITVTPDGVLVDGRNRLEACRRAGVEPVVEVWDGDDVGAFVRSRNERRHQSTGSRAMSTALSLEHDGKRTIDKAGKGRWAQGSLSSTDPSNSQSWAARMRQAGTILDEISAEHSNLNPQLAWDVVSGEVALDDAYRRACAEREKREAEQRRIQAEEEREVKEEADAVRYFEQHPEAQAWLDNKPEGSFDTMREAFNARMAADRKERMAEEARRREEEQKRRDHEEARKRDAGRLRAFLDGWETAWGMRDNQFRDEILNNLDTVRKERFLEIERSVGWPTERF